jgi:hypothetical protein
MLQDLSDVRMFVIFKTDLAVSRCVFKRLLEVHMTVSEVPYLAMLFPSTLVLTMSVQYTVHDMHILFDISRQAEVQ